MVLGASCKITATQTVHQATTGPVPAGASQCVAPEAVVNPTVATGFNPGAGTVPGNNQNSATLPFKNFQVSDVPSNWDYSFRAGIFAGDYTMNASGSINPNLTKNGDDPNAHRIVGLGPTLGTAAVPVLRRASSRDETRSASSRMSSSTA